MKQFRLLLLLFIPFMITSCAYVSPKEVTLRVQELGEDAGEIDIMRVPGGYAIAGWSASDYSFPITEQNYRWTADDQGEYGSERDESIKLQIEGNDCTLDLGIRFYVNNTMDKELKYLVTKYPTDLDGVVDVLLYDIVRGATKEAFQGKSLDNVMDELSTYIRGPITEAVTVKAIEYAITVVEVYDISGLNAPESVMAAKRATQKSAQDEQKADADQRAQAVRDATMIATAKAEAEANKLRNSNPPNDQVLRQMMIEKWDGNLAPGANVMLADDILKH